MLEEDVLQILLNLGGGARWASHGCTAVPRTPVGPYCRQADTPPTRFAQRAVETTQWTRAGATHFEQTKKWLSKQV